VHTGVYSEEEQAKKVIIIDEEGKVYAAGRKDLQKNKMLLHPILLRSSNLDMPCPSVSLTPPLS
jgi:hypothetical protein